MYSTENTQISNNAFDIHQLFIRIICAVKRLKRNSNNKIIIAVLLLFGIVFWMKNTDPYEESGIETFDRVIFLVFFYVLCLLLYSYPIMAYRFKKAFINAGICNHSGKVPILSLAEKSRDQSRMIIYTFESIGIPLEKWIEKKALIENALNICLIEIEQGKSKREVVLYATSGTYDITQNIYDRSNNSNLKYNEILLGENCGYPITMKLDEMPHMLIGGSSGSGKTYLLKNILRQCIKKDYIIYLADFKGGVDYPEYWHDNCSFICDIDSLIDALKTNIMSELELRKKVLREKECANIDTYNIKFNTSVRRIIFACDEVAELLDKTGVTKEEKEKIAIVENYLSTIARQGRAFGIHLILVTQRPDANILAGQIKNNIDCRICGRADNVLSQIILDNTDAADQIPKNAQGLFLNQDNLLFKAYYSNEDNNNFFRVNDEVAECLKNIMMS